MESFNISHSKDWYSDSHHCNCDYRADKIDYGESVFELFRHAFVIDQNNHALQNDQNNFKYLYDL